MVSNFGTDARQTREPPLHKEEEVANLPPRVGADFAAVIELKDIIHQNPRHFYACSDDFRFHIDAGEGARGRGVHPATAPPKFKADLQGRFGEAARLIALPSTQDVRAANLCGKAIFVVVQILAERSVRPRSHTIKDRQANEILAFRGSLKLNCRVIGAVRKEPTGIPRLTDRLQHIDPHKRKHAIRARLVAARQYANSENYADG